MESTPQHSPATAPHNLPQSEWHAKQPERHCRPVALERNHWPVSELLRRCRLIQPNARVTPATQKLTWKKPRPPAGR